MAKTLKDFLNERQLGPMVVKNPDEQKFVDKHVTAKTADRNGNGDDVFKGEKVKKADRKSERHGYEPGEDEEVYEELTGKQHKIDANKNGKVDAHDFKLLRGKKKVAEEADQIDELSDTTLGSYTKKAAADFRARKPKMGYDGQLKKMQNRQVGVNRALDKMYGEEAEELEELSKDTVRNYFNKGGEQGKKITDKMKMSGGDWTADGSATKTLRKRATGRAMAYKRRTGEIKMSEESEQIDELSKKTLNSYVVKALVPSSEKSVSNLASKGGYKLGQQARDDEIPRAYRLRAAKRSLGVLSAVRKLTKESRAMAVASKLTTQYGSAPLNKEERLLSKLADISETHKRTMVSVFEKLNEDNQYAFMQACDTADGIEQMLDFSISYRGE